MEGKGVHNSLTKVNSLKKCIVCCEKIGNNLKHYVMECQCIEPFRALSESKHMMSVTKRVIKDILKKQTICMCKII